MKWVIFSLFVLQISFLNGNGFTDTGTQLPGVNRASLAWGDFNNDGFSDLIITGDYNTSVFRNDNGNFVNVNTGILNVGYGSVEWGDYNNDGFLDILISGWNGSANTKIYRNNGNGTFSDINANLPGVYHGVSTWGDYNSDGYLDILLTGNSPYGYISRLYKNNGNGTFTDTNISFPGLIYSNAKFGDFDGDGDLDILINGNTGSGRITRLYNNNSGVFTSVSHNLPNVESGPFDWFDIEGDGDQDIILTGWDGVNVITDVYRNDNGLFYPLNTGMTKMYAGSTHWGDFNNDGYPDVLVNGYSSQGYFTKVYQNDVGIFTDTNCGLPGIRWGWSRWCDYDNDGDLDFAMAGNKQDNLNIAKLYRNDFVETQLPPAEPVALNAISIGTNVFTALWETSLRAQGYRLDVSTDSTFTNFLANYNDLDVNNVDRHEVGNLSEKNRYYYRVRAYNAYGVSGNSNRITITTSNSGSSVEGGYVSGIWVKSGSPYYVYGDIIIKDGEKLSIEPGCEVVFMGHFRLIVQGCLDAVGDKNDFIYFKANNINSGWMGIRFINTPHTNPKSKIGYCYITDGNANIFGGTECYGGGISIQSYSNIDIFNNVFENNKASAGSAINCYNSSPKISENIFRNNRAGYDTGSAYGTLNCMFTSNPIISNNVFEDNWLIAESSKYAAGAAIRCVFGSDAQIRNNIIRRNYIVSDGNLSEGTAMYIHSSSPLVINNLIYDNFIEPSYSHGSGGAIFFYDSNAKLINNTIRANYAREGGALWFKLSSPDFHNNIIRGNEDISGEQQVFFDDDESDPNFYHNNIQGGKENFAFKYPEYTFTGDWHGNIDEDPKYVGGGDGKNYDFRLSFDSPCIDSGSLAYLDPQLIEEYDLFGNQRIFGNGIDIGALEAYLAVPSNVSVTVSSSTIYLSWEAVPGAVSYIIYSSDDPFGEFILEGIVTNNSYQTPVTEKIKFFYIRSSN